MCNAGHLATVQKMRRFRWGFEQCQRGSQAAHVGSQLPGHGAAAVVGHEQAAYIDYQLAVSAGQDRTGP